MVASRRTGRTAISRIYWRHGPSYMDDHQVATKLAILKKLAAEIGRRDAQPSAPCDEVIQLDDFVAYLPKHNFIFLPTREPWPATSVNARIAPVEDGDETIAAST